MNYKRLFYEQMKVTCSNFKFKSFFFTCRARDRLLTVLLLSPFTMSIIFSWMPWRVPKEACASNASIHLWMDSQLTVMYNLLGRTAMTDGLDGASVPFRGSRLTFLVASEPVFEGTLKEWTVSSKHLSMKKQWSHGFTWNKGGKKTQPKEKDSTRHQPSSSCRAS